MTIQFSENFEGGTNGANVTSSNTSFGGVTGASVTFSNAHLLTSGGGTLAAKVSASSTVPQMGASGTTPMWTGVGKVYYRFYWYCESFPTANSALGIWKELANSHGALAESPRVLTTGVVQIRNDASTAVASSAASFIAASTYYRFEGMIDVANQQQQLKAFKGTNVHGTTADYDSGVVSSTVTGATVVDSFALGFINSTTGIGHFDNVVVQDTGFPGPVTGTGDAKVWNGTAWVAKPVKVWNGTAWVQKPVKFWNGTAWTTTSY